jgi:CMP-N-acetylneuraminic acid synthetase
LQHYDGLGRRADIVLSLQPTCPLLEIASIDAGLARVLDNSHVDSAVSVTLIRKCHPFRSYRLGVGCVIEPLTEYTTEKYLQKQDRPPAYGLTGGFFIRRRALLENCDWQGFAFGDRCAGQVVSEEEAVDIDSEVDFLLAEAILARRNAAGQCSSVE